MESVLKSLFKRELKAILAPYADIICALFIIAIIGYIIYYLYNKFNENKIKNNVNSIVNNSLKCPNCGLEISPEDRFCLKCGTALTPQTINPSTSPKSFSDTLLQILVYTIKYALIGFAILFILLILIGIMAE